MVQLMLNEIRQCREEVLLMIDQMIDVHQGLCEVEDCDECNYIALHGFVYEVLTSYIRNQKGQDTYIADIIRANITYCRLSVSDMRQALILLEEYFPYKIQYNMKEVIEQVELTHHV